MTGRQGLLYIGKSLQKLPYICIKFDFPNLSAISWHPDHLIKPDFFLQKNRYTSATGWAFRAELVIKMEGHGPTIKAWYKWVTGVIHPAYQWSYRPYKWPGKWVLLGLFHPYKWSYFSPYWNNWWFWAHFIVFHVPCSTPHISTGVPLHPKAARVNPSDSQKKQQKQRRRGK